MITTTTKIIPGRKSWDGTEIPAREIPAWRITGTVEQIDRIGDDTVAGAIYGDSRIALADGDVLFGDPGTTVDGVPLVVGSEVDVTITHRDGVGPGWARLGVVRPTGPTAAQAAATAARYAD